MVEENLISMRKAREIRIKQESEEGLKKKLYLKL